MRISVTYNHPNGIDAELDKKIKGVMELMGCKWYAQGTNLETGERDIAFNYLVTDDILGLIITYRDKTGKNPAYVQIPEWAMANLVMENLNLANKKNNEFTLPDGTVGIIDGIPIRINHQAETITCERG